MAKFLLSLTDAEWTDWELDFLDHMSRFEGPEAISQRQREVLFELDAKGRSYSVYQGFSVRHLVAQCYVSRFDLDDENAEFLVRLHETNSQKLKRTALTRLVSCARALGVIERASP